MTTLVVVSRVLLVVAFLGGLTFIAAYHVTARWWRSSIGRTWMSFVVAETLLLGTGIWAMLFGDSPPRRIISVAAFTLFTVASWWRAVTLLRTQVRRSEPDTGRHPER